MIDHPESNEFEEQVPPPEGVSFSGVPAAAADGDPGGQGAFDTMHFLPTAAAHDAPVPAPDNSNEQPSVLHAMRYPAHVWTRDEVDAALNIVGSPPPQHKPVRRPPTTLQPQPDPIPYDRELPEDGTPPAPAADTNAVEPVPDHQEVAQVIDRSSAPWQELYNRIEGKTLEEAGFTVVDVRSLGSAAMKPFTIISGVLGARDFDTVEGRIVASLGPYPDESPRVAMARERYAGDPIQGHVRSRKFNGRLLEGQVILLPFDIEIPRQHNGGLRKQFDAMSPQARATIKGVTALYTGILKGVRGTVGRLELPVTYHLRAGTPGSLYTGRRNFGHTVRVIGTSDSREVEAVVRQQNEDSITRAYRSAQFALTHLYSAGSPGGGTVNSKGGHV